jgi:hypothetical protein
MMAKRGSVLIRSTRYEYTTDNNVSKIYYIQNSGAPETIGAEFLSFDSHQRFFAGSPDLSLVEIYNFDYEPSVNNLLSLKLYATPGATYATAQNIDFTITYNGKGFVESINTSFYASPKFTFNRMNYSCR